MSLTIATATLVVDNYDRGIDFYCGVLGLTLLADTALGGGKRWVVVAGSGGARLLIAQADGDAQTAAIGHQTGGRVAFFMETDDFERDHARLVDAGVHFLEAPRHEAYGSVAVFEDPFGNKWDLIAPKPAA
jgi:catechol 2,3-dioxygenase-like lactoylglutathione lyase family enzyme